MSGIINKVKEVLHSSDDKSSSTTHSTTSGAPEGTHGPHGSRVANAADPRVDSDRDGSHQPGHTAGHNEYGSGRGGFTHGAGIGHDVGSGTIGSDSGTREGEHGPHSSRIANAADPRVDSDRDGSHNTGAYGTGHSTGTSGFGSTGTHTGTAGYGSNSGTREGEHGPHSSRIANAADPRVESDRDGSHNTGAYSTGQSGYGTGHNTGSSDYNTGSSGLGHSSGTREGEHGPHSSRIANAADPRVDSDRDGSHNTGAYSTGHSTTGQSGYGTGHNTGSSDYNTGSSGFGSSTTGHHAGGGTTGLTGNHGASTGTYGEHNAPGPAPKTAGPHKSDVLNKLDPRVDSDLDGSKTAGGNKTFQSGTHSSGQVQHRDPTDAAQVPPSVLRKTLGDPVVEHDDHTHARDRRNSSATHQETYRGM